ncbi:MAG: DUF4469 domain-containing protein [Treponema sp.]|jgi:hypothetical protein|nr:DUF4469 domain-containing protein [Treponema sp.]
MDDLPMILHRIRARLYPNNLKNVEGKYIARMDHERTLDIKDICTIIKTRLETSVRYEELLDYIQQYVEEVAYQLCDGYSVTNGYYTIHPNIGGSFNKVNEAHDHDKHPISFRFSARSRLLKLARNIDVSVEGLANINGYIDSFTDFDLNSTNNLFSPGGQFAIHGNKIRVEGEDHGIGVFFVPVDNPSEAVKVTRIGENNPSRITGIIPQTGYPQCRIEVRTQFSGPAGRFLKKLRTITSSFIVEEA